MRQKQPERTRIPPLVRFPAYAVTVAALLQCSVSRSKQDVPFDGGGLGSIAAQSNTVQTLEILRAQVERGAPQGVLRVAMVPEAAITISIEPGPELERSCLAMMATAILLKAGYSAVPTWNHNMPGPIVHLNASANFSDGKTTLVLQGNIGRHLGAAPALYEAALISGNRNPTTAEVEALVARIVQSELFRNYAAAIQPGHGAMVGLMPITSDKIEAACEVKGIANTPNTGKTRGRFGN